MTTQLLAALLVLAVLVFWVIGAHNRLVALRNQISSAWTRVQETLAPRAGAVQTLADSLREPMGSEAGALDAWLAAHQAAVQAAGAMNNKPVHPDHAQAWVAAEATLAAAASRVLALLEQHSALAAQAPVATALASWRQAHSQLPFARQFFNDAARSYNEAVAQFPTQLVARALGLGASGLL